MDKGISPIIASVLIILVVVSLAGTYTVWSSRIFGEVTEEGGETVTRTTKALFSDFEVQSAADQRVFIKNTGSSGLTASALQVFYDGEPIEYTADFDILESDGLGTLRLQGLNEFGGGDHIVKITGGAFTDSIGVTATNIVGITGEWSFDEGSGTRTSDTSGNGND